MTHGRSARLLVGGLAYAWPVFTVGLGLASDYWRWNADGRPSRWVDAFGVSAVALPALTLAWLAVLTPRSWPRRVLRPVLAWTLLGLELVVLAVVLVASSGV
ncbi:MAG: hypothetical protein L6Q99_02920 [Planctomycetes bacterium]|nr:hypothetical protein [Planctomycetota bacterium]